MQIEIPLALPRLNKLILSFESSIEVGMDIESSSESIRMAIGGLNWRNS